MWYPGLIMISIASKSWDLFKVSKYKQHMFIFSIHNDFYFFFKEDIYLNLK